ncbi:hypothetical protein ACQ4PT_044788 [Festuca glaucescens]
MDESHRGKAAEEGDSGPHSRAPGAAKKRDSSPDSEASPGSETEREAKKKRISPGEEMELAQLARPEMRGAGDDHQDEFTPKSPISMPYIPDELKDPTAYPATLAAFEEAEVKYNAKLRRRYRLFSLPREPEVAPSCLVHQRHLLPIREPAKKAVLRAAKSIVRLSSSVDGKPLASCCGLWIDWEKESKTGIVLTTAHLIRSKHPTQNHWEGTDEYNTKSNVIVHLLDGTTADAHYLYHQEHYDLAFFKVRVVEQVELPLFSDSVHCGQDVFRLGRDDHMNLRITHGRVEDRNPVIYERHHYMYFLHQKNDCLSHQKKDNYISHEKNDECDDDGGSVIDLDGKVSGLVNKNLENSFVPSCILDKCVDLWRKFRCCIPRLHLGMKFSSIKFLDPIQIENMWRMYKIEDGLIVKEVSKESHAEKLGICIGDIIERFNGERVSTTVELENMLLDRCRDHLDQGGQLNEKIDVSIQVFHAEERLRRNISLIVDVSDGGEVVKRRTYPITAIEGMSASGQSSQNVAGPAHSNKRWYWKPQKEEKCSWLS